MHIPSYTWWSTVNIMADIIQRWWVWSSIYPASMFANTITDAESILFVIIDWLGYERLMTHRPDSFLAQDCRWSLTSTFPSSTTVACTTFYLGLPAAQSGLTWWTMRDNTINDYVHFLPGTQARTYKPLTDPQAASLIHLPSIFSYIAWHTTNISSAHYISSWFNRDCVRAARNLYYHDFSDFDQAVLASLETQTRFTLAYWWWFDTIQHDTGTISPETMAEFDRIDTAYAWWRANNMHGRKICVIADHGMIDTPAEKNITIDRDDDLSRLCIRRPSGEQRFAYWYCFPWKKEEFLTYATDRWGQIADFFPSNEILWRFGYAPHTPKLLERIGDVVMVMKENYTVHITHPQRRYEHLVWDHGWLTDQERLVPWIIS